jgi:hypothetical protein
MERSVMPSASPLAPPVPDYASAPPGYHSEKAYGFSATGENK